MRRLKLAPNLNFDQIYVTAETASTWALGAYYSLPMMFGKLLLNAPVVVLENERYSILIKTQLLRKHQVIVSKKWSIIYARLFITLISEKPMKEKGKKVQTFTLEYSIGIF